MKPNCKKNFVKYFLQLTVHSWKSQVHQKIEIWKIFTMIFAIYFQIFYAKNFYMIYTMIYLLNDVSKWHLDSKIKSFSLWVTMCNRRYVYRSSEYCSFQNLERERRGSFDDEMNNKIRHKNPDLVNFAAGLTLLMIKF